MVNCSPASWANSINWRNPIENTLSWEQLCGQWAKSAEKIAETAMTLQSLLEPKGIEGPALFATPFMMHFSAVTAGFFLLEQALIASEKFEVLKQEKQVRETNVSEFLQDNAQARFYDSKNQNGPVLHQSCIAYF